MDIMKKSLIYLIILLFFFVDNASARLGVTTKGAGLSFGNLRLDGKIIDGLSLRFGNPFRSNLNPPIDEVNGLSIALAPASRRMNGILISPLRAEARDGITGLAIGGLRVGGGDSKGIFISGYAATAKKITGFALSSVVLTKKAINGLAIGALGVYSEDVKGVIIGGLYAVPTEMRGITIGGILSGADQAMIGLSIGLVNGAKRFNGVQIGMYNTVEILHGIQIGLINHAENNPKYLRWLPVINMHF